MLQTNLDTLLFSSNSLCRKSPQVFEYGSRVVAFPLKKIGAYLTGFKSRVLGTLTTKEAPKSVAFFAAHASAFSSWPEDGLPQRPQPRLDRVGGITRVTVSPSVSTPIFSR
jgi:hypothetical protein